jgi:hypothetical protein
VSMAGSSRRLCYTPGRPAPSRSESGQTVLSKVTCVAEAAWRPDYAADFWLRFHWASCTVNLLRKTLSKASSKAEATKKAGQR